MERYMIDNNGYVCDKNLEKARFWTRTGACNAVTEVKRATNDIDIITRYPRYERLDLPGFRPKLIVRLIGGANRD